MGIGAELKEFVAAFESGWRLSSDRADAKDRKAMDEKRMALSERGLDLEAERLGVSQDQFRERMALDQAQYEDQKRRTDAQIAGVGAWDSRTAAEREAEADNDLRRQYVPEVTRSLLERTSARGYTPEETQHALALIGYETGGSYDPWQRGPRTQWGEHRGLIQWGEPQREQYGVSQDTPIPDQVEAALQYIEDRGYKPGTNNFDGLYATVNGGNVRAVNASDEAAGGMPGTVRDKVRSKAFQEHLRNAQQYIARYGIPEESV